MSSVVDWAGSIMDALQGHGLPARSVLFALQPLGSGTAFRESLWSYFLRLVDAHGLAPRTFAAEILGPLLGMKGDPASWKGDSAWTGDGFGAFTEPTKAWAKALMDLTCVNSLLSLTLVALEGKVSNQGLFAKAHRWCPLCLREDEAAGGAYGHLLWRIEGVVACPRHRVRLVAQCTCGMQVASNPLNSKFLPHICKCCGANLGSREEASMDAASDSEVGQATLFADLIESGALEHCAAPLPNGGIATFLSRLAEVRFERKASSLATRLGVGKSTLHGWMRGGHLPTLHQVSLIAGTFGCSMSDVLKGSVDGIGRSAPPASKLDGATRGYVSHDWGALGQALKNLLANASSSEEPQPTTAVARRFGVDPSALLRRYPNECRELIRRRKEWMLTRKQEKREYVRTMAREKSLKLASNGIRPTWRRLHSALKGQVGVFSKEMKKELQLGVAEGLQSLQP